MFVEAKNTYFDSPERSTFLQIENKSHRINRDPIITQMMESFPDLVLILDSNRQIVAYNKKAESFFANKNEIEILGNRLGEALGCIHAFDNQAGCAG